MKDETVAAASGLPFETWISRTLAACLFVPLFLPPLHGVFRAAVRPWVLFHVERGLLRVQQLERLRTPLLTSISSWCCLTVSTEFYVTFLPALCWVFNPQLGCRLIFTLAFALYVGGAMKDLVCAPRPAEAVDADGKQRVTAHAQTTELVTSAKEFGLPSSHTLNSCVLNYYMIYYSLEHGMISTSTGRLLYVLASVWIAFIAFSRMYLGMHTPIDVLGGMLGGVAVLNFFITVDDELEGFITGTRPAIILPLLLGAAAVALRCHPRPVRHTPTFDDSTAIVAVAVGAALGLSRGQGWLLHPARRLLWRGLWESGGAAAVLRRLGAGFLLLAGLQAVAKRIALVLVPPLYLLCPVQLRRLWQPPMHSLRSGTQWEKYGIPVNAAGRPWDVVETARFAAYASIGWVVVEGAPSLFSHLGW